MTKCELINESAAMEQALARRQLRLIVTTWIAYLSPSLMLALLGLLTNNSAEVGASMLWLFIGMPTALIGQTTTRQTFASMNIRYPMRDFIPLTFAKACKIGALSAAGGLFFVFPYWAGYWSSHPFTQQLPYWIILAFVVFSIYRSLVRGRIHLDGEVLRITHFLYSKTITASDVVDVEIIGGGRFIPRARVGFRLLSGALVMVPSMQFLLVGPNEVERSRRNQLNVEYLFQMVNSCATEIIGRFEDPQK